jgi:hypothetical protein
MFRATSAEEFGATAAKGLSVVMMGRRAVAVGVAYQFEAEGCESKEGTGEIAWMLDDP